MDLAQTETSDMLSVATPDIKKLAAALAPELAAPNLVDMWEDIKKVAHNVSKLYVDQSCYALSYEELVAECMSKVAKLVHKGWLTRAQTRAEFFSVLKTTMSNHVRGLVQRHRFTAKRTGVAPPPQGQVDFNAKSRKPEVSLDDPEMVIQLTDHRDIRSGETGLEEITEDFKVLLLPVEALVLTQLLSPNDGAYVHAYLSASLGRRRSESLEVIVDLNHMAEGLGLDEPTFTKIRGEIRRKYALFMKTQAEDTDYNASLTALEAIFEVQVPRSTATTIVARLFTIAARDQLGLVNPEIVRHLKVVGARPPEVSDGRLNCFGVLYSKNHRACLACGLRDACRVEAANYGLGEITLSPKLLGSRQVRTAVLTGQRPAVSTEATATTTITTGMSAKHPGVVVTSERDEALLTFLEEHFRSAVFSGDVYYRHRTGKTKYIFCAGREGQPFRLRFCKADDSLQSRLERDGRSFYLPADVSAEAATRLITQHADLATKE